MTASPFRQFALDLATKASVTRDDVVVTNANRLAVAAIDAWPSWPHPVLVIVGPEGAGKTHLAAAWSRRADAVAPSAARAARVPFAVALDDVEGWADDETTLFDLLDRARLGEGFVLATARRRPAEIRFGTRDLMSRLQAATLVEIASPDDELLHGVLVKLFADRQLAVEPRHLDYLALRMERSLAAARRIVERIDREALETKEKVTRTLIRRILDAEPGTRRDETAAEPAGET